MSISTSLAALQAALNNFQTLFSNQVPAPNFPVSRYGELSYLPVGVSGSFEGASTDFGSNFSMRYYPCIVEADGTLVYLRNGTTGSKRGVYYAYSKNALTVNPIAVPIRTNTKYQPSYFPNGYTAAYVWKSDNNVIWGQLQDSSGNMGNMFLSLTGNTFNQLNHVGCFFSLSSINVAANGSSYPEAFLAGSNVYLVVPGPSVYNQPVEFSVYSIPVSAVQAGGTVTPTLVTGWTTTGFYGNYSGNTIRVANMQSSPNASDQPLVRYDNTVLTAPNIYPFHNAANTYDMQSAYDPATGNCRTRITGLYWIQNTLNGQTIQLWQVFSFTWNVGTKTAAIDAGLGPGLATLDGNGKISVTGPLMNGDKSTVGPNNFQTGDNKYYHPSGYWLSVNDSSQPDYACYLSRAMLTTPGLSKYQALQYNQTCSNTNRSAVGFTPAYGSAVGGALMGSYQLPGNSMLVSGNGLTVGGTVQRSLALVTRGAAGWTYGSLSNGSYSGFAPTTARKMVTDLGFSQVTFTGLMAEIDSSNNVSATGNSYLEGIQTSGFVSCDQNLNISTPVSISAAAASSLKAAILSAISQTASYSFINIYVPQNPNVPPFAFVHFIQSGSPNYECVAFAELTITAGSRNSSITGFGIASSANNIQMVQYPTNITADPNFSCICGGVTILETSDAYLIGGSGKQTAARPGWSGNFIYRFAVPKSNNRPDWTTLSVSAEWMQFASNFYTAVPGLGFGYNYQQLNNGPADSDYYTKLLFVPVATNLTTFKSWAPPSAASWRVQVSQDVAQGWIVYFTDVTPIILNSTYYQMQPATIDLSTIQGNPANTTFYVYVKIQNGSPAYVITTTQQAESATVVYLGTIVTNATQITSINVQKTTRLDVYRPSITKAGSAVSVSSGTPDAAAHLDWI